jgi:hypothetical protein
VGVVGGGGVFLIRVKKVVVVFVEIG